MENAVAATASETLTQQEQLPAGEHPALVYLTSLQSPASRRTMRSALDRIAELVTGGEADHETFPWHRLRYQHTAAIRSKLADLYAPATVNKYLSAIRGVLREAWRLGYLEADTYQRAADVEGMKHRRLPSGRRLSLGELHALKAVCERDKSPAGTRDLALIAVLARGGLRRSEAVALELADYRPGEDDGPAELVVRSGKGDKDRVVALANGARRALEDWIAVRGQKPGALFCPVDKGGSIEIRHMSGNAVYLMLQKRQEEAGVQPFSPHDLRRTCASDLLEHGNDLAVTSEMLGHASTDTTRRYDRRGDEAKRKAAGTLPF